jgi:hypothetical protein
MKRLWRVLLKMLAASAVLTLLFVSSAIAQEVVVDQGYTNGEEGNGWIQVDSTQTQAQTITTASGGWLDSASFLVWQKGPDPGLLCADLWSASNDTPVELRQPLGCQNFDSETEASQWANFEFESTPYMRPGEQYAIVLHNDSPEGQGYYWQFAQEFNNSGQPDSTFCADKLYTRGTAFSALYSGYPAVEWNRAACVDFFFMTRMLKDTTAPSGTILINNGDTRTTERLVTLNLSARDPEPSSGVTQMRFKNAGTDTVWSAWQPYKSSRSWYLTPGEGTKRVAAQFKDAAGNRSAPVYDYIIFRR